jgi:predicted pyridoxine 5'-phosphate oxidase superfamily flavin-nucleotide-binding protein
MDNSPFHADELAAQRLAGGGPGGAAIRDFMPDQYRGFFASLRYVAVATPDRDGWPVATMLTGLPGFVHALDPATLRFDVLPEPSDPVRAVLTPGQDIGVLGIDLATRRRNRANGHLVTLDSQGMTVAVTQSFGNCPQYIQRRLVHPMPHLAHPTEFLDRLDEAAKTLIDEADTFFVASRSRLNANAYGGADISHRGGRPDFVRIEGDTLWIPDFHGNRYFNTLGNLLGQPRTALLFIDFEQGDLLHLQGLAEIDWASNPERVVDGAERYWRVHVRCAWRRRAALPLRWSFVDQAPTTALTGIWHEA